jgi:putative exosortase-associated protein (TIGR04073 family)
MLRRRFVWIGALLVALLCLSPPAARSTAFEEDATDIGSPGGKLARGGLNLVTGWMEIPVRIHETSQNSGVTMSFTWGLLRGIGHAFVRTAAGAYEIITFPFPAPPDYQPVIQPEYIFSESATAGNDHDF